MSHIIRIGSHCGKYGFAKNFTNFIEKNKTHVNGRMFMATDAATKKSTGRGVAKFDSKDENEILEKLKFSFDSDGIAGNIVPVYKRALLYGRNVAIKDEMGEYSYIQLYMGAKKLATEISNLCGK